jgi:general secretion pathway protein K
MKISLKQKNSGIAIVIVMITIFVLTMIAAGFAISMKVESRLAMNANSETEMEWLARSGVEYCKWVLANKPPNEQYDALNQLWAGGPGGTNDADIGISRTVELGGGKFTWRMKDAERKFNINTTVNNAQVLEHTLTLAGVDATEVSTISSSVQDWIDKDDNTHINGAESEYYQSCNPPYYAKNGPFDDVTELLYVKGVSPEMFWGPNSTNHAQSIFSVKSPVQTGALPTTPVIPVGLVDIFTTISEGHINVNTASVTTLQMIPGVDENIANDIVMGRQGPDGVDGTEDDMPYQSPNDLGRVGASNQGTLAIQQFITVRSTTFEVEIDAEIGQMKRTYTALLRRNSPRDIQILKMNWK